MFELILNRCADISREDAKILSLEELEAWPHADVAALQQLGLVKKASPAKIVECIGCEESCLMPVNTYPAQEGRDARIFVSCDKREDTGRILIEPETLAQWQIDISYFVTLLASALGTGHAADEIISQQVFYLGALTIKRKRRSAIFITNEVILNSALELVLFRQYAHPFFLVAAELDRSQEVKQGLAILSLSQLLLVSDGKSLSLDRETLEHLIFREDNRQPLVKGNKSKNAIKKNIFRRDGQKWILRFKEGKYIFCNDNKGFLYIFYLLGCPHIEVHSQQLKAFAEGVKLENIVGTGGVENSLEFREGSQSDSSDQLIIDEQARKEYKDEINKLRELIDIAKKDGDQARKRLYQKEYDKLAKDVIAASRLGGKTRNMVDDPEKARKSVSEAIRRGMKIIEKEYTELHTHLKNSITLGEYCTYTPEEEIGWDLNSG